MAICQPEKRDRVQFFSVVVVIFFIFTANKARERERRYDTMTYTRIYSNLNKSE